MSRKSQLKQVSVEKTFMKQCGNSIPLRSKNGSASYIRRSLIVRKGSFESLVSYHGIISREKAESILEAHKQVNCYLIRRGISVEENIFIISSICFLLLRKCWRIILIRDG